MFKYAAAEDVDPLEIWWLAKSLNKITKRVSISRFRLVD
jgi:hypothetical protein